MSLHRTNVIWEPFPGSQKKFMKCPVWECLLHGNRGGGKTDVLVMDYLQGVGKGYGSDYKGLLLREATTELGDVISKTRKWIPRIFPTAKYNASKKIWTFEGGETLWLNYARTLADYDQYHGHEYPWIGWEELTNHVFPTVYLKLMSCNRSSNKLITPRYRSTCNPSGPGHAWVKQRFIDVCDSGKIFREELEFEFPDENGKMQKQNVKVARTHVQSYMSENKALLEADPMYMAKIYSLTQDNEMLRKAWIDGSWDLLIGGFFTDVWDKDIHVLPTFKVPKSWRLIRSFDWGSSKPWAVSYAFEANGEQPDANMLGGLDIPYIPKGSVIVPNEIYGWNGSPNEGDRATSQQIATRVLGVDNALLNEYDVRCIAGPADTSIYDVRDGTSIGKELIRHGCSWTKAYKGSGSRIAGWAIIRQMLGASKRRELESPHLYFFAAAEHHIRTLPQMQRDKTKPEDIDTDLEDHCFAYNTKITTDKGFEKIGDLVGQTGRILTVNGKFTNFYNCRLVKKETETIKITFSDGFSVSCTPDHKFLTTKGFIKAKNLLTHSDISVIVSKIEIKEKNKWKEFVLYQKLFKNFVERDIIFVGNISKTRGIDYTETSGNFLKDLFQKAMMFITKKKTHIKTKKRTLNYGHNTNIDHSIQQKETPPQQNNALKHLRNGTKLKREKIGMQSTLKKPMKLCTKITYELVYFAKKVVCHVERMWIYFAQINANPLIVENQELMILKESVSYVPQHLQSTNTPQDKLVQVNAHQNYVLEITEISTVKENQDVYCMTVPKYHTFALENGVVVSNCMDSLRYLLARRLTTMRRRSVRN